MSKELRLLIVEDVPGDVVLINHELRKNGLAFVSRRVEARDDFLRELRQHPPDLVLTDHGLPTFDAFNVLAIMRDQHPEIPCIFVSGVMNEELAVEAIKSGAVDCVSKERLSSRLVPAVREALRVAHERRRQHEAELEREHHLRDLEAALARFKALSASLPICCRCKRKIRDPNGGWQHVEQYLEPQPASAPNPVICPECAQGRSEPLPNRPRREPSPEGSGG
ncbi:MAG: response regulator [Verrucomicrobia bacterium]|nr:response regulator [Verrucomicrobiota bacterium]